VFMRASQVPGLLWGDPYRIVHRIWFVHRLILNHDAILYSRIMKRGEPHRLGNCYKARLVSHAFESVSAKI